MKTFLFLVCWPSALLFSGYTVFAQRSPDYSLPAGISLRSGLNQLYGDLRDPLATPGFGLDLLLPITAAFGVGLLFDSGKLKAKQEEYYHSVSTARYRQAALAGSLDLLRLFSREQRRAEIYVYSGGGLIFFHARASDLATGALQRLTNNAASYRTRDGVHTRGKPGIRFTHELAILAGLRAATALGRRVTLSGELRFNWVRTDKLDATLDGNRQTIHSGRAQTEGNHYGKNSPDRWGFMAVGLSWYFGDHSR